MRYFLRLSYNGSAFSGWQVQENARSVQGELEKALSIRCKEAVSVTGAGRTDAGVNASGYIAHFDSACEIEKDARTNKMKGILYGYYIGAMLSTDSDSVKHLNVLKEIHNIFAENIIHIDINLSIINFTILLSN